LADPPGASHLLSRTQLQEGGVFRSKPSER
jgi:hypothetical protein